MRRIEVLRIIKLQHQQFLCQSVVVQVVEQVVEPVGIDEIINHIEHETHIDF